MRVASLFEAGAAERVLGSASVGGTASCSGSLAAGGGVISSVGRPGGRPPEPLEALPSELLIAQQHA